MLASAAFDTEQRILELEFTNGRVYRYFDVLESLYERLIEADSNGRFFTLFIRDRYRFERIK